VKNAGKIIQNHWIWQNLNFEIFPGDKVAIVGVSGSGKSLLLRALAGLDPLQKGQIYFQGKSLDSLSLPHYRSQVIYLHQRPALWEGTVEDNLQQVYSLAIHRHRNYNRNLILEYLKLLDKPVDFLQRPVSAISGGEAQIVVFLRALQFSPQVLLLDEPTASLDANTTHNLETLITAWYTQSPQRAYIFTSHESAQLQRITNRKISLQQENNVN
jgi:putative ABC transport system ATP-binding protein